MITTTTGGTDHTPIMVSDIGDITADHSPAPIHATTEVAVLEGTPCALCPAIAAACTTLRVMDGPVTPCAIVTPYPTLATSPAGTTHATLCHWMPVSLQQLPPHNTMIPT